MSGNEPIEEEQEMDLHEELRELLNRHSRENASGTPDYVLAAFLVGCLDTFELAVVERDEWWSFEPRLDDGTLAVDAWEVRS